MKTRMLVIALGLLFVAGSAQAVEVGGVTLPETQTVEEENLELNGAGLRSRFFFKVYTGALYLPAHTRDAERAMDMPGVKRIRLYMLRDVDRSTMTDALNDALSNNLSAEQLEALSTEAAAFRELFPDLTAGDVVDIDFLPGTGTRVSIDEGQRGTVEGDTFARAVMAIWLGDNPADRKVKLGMLGR